MMFFEVAQTPVRAPLERGRRHANEKYSLAGTPGERQRRSSQPFHVKGGQADLSGNISSIICTAWSRTSVGFWQSLHPRQYFHLHDDRHA